jgi:hypothetical protein
MEPDFGDAIDLDANFTMGMMADGEDEIMIDFDKPIYGGGLLEQQKFDLEEQPEEQAVAFVRSANDG